MLAEWLLYLATSAPRHVRRDGYVREAVGLWSRARRHRNAWAPHLQRCSAFIEKTASGLERGGKAVILGSGLLHDVPLALLAGKFDEVLLADIVHLPVACWTARRFANVTLCDVDLTGLGDLSLAPRNLQPGSCDAFLADPDIRYVVSLNLLSQLPLVPLERFEARFALSDTESETFTKALWRAHLQYLSRFKCPVTLISDFERLTLDATGKIIEREDALFGLVPAEQWRESAETWDWDIAPLGEWAAHQALRNRVMAIADIRPRISSGSMPL